MNGMRRNLFAAAAAALGLTLTGSVAQAEYFTYTSTVTVNSANTTAGSSITPTGGGNAVTVTTPAGTTVKFGTVSSSAPANGASLSQQNIGTLDVTTTTTTPSEPNLSFGFTYNVTLTNYTDVAGNNSTGTGTMAVSGVLQGSIGFGRAVALTNLSTYTMSPFQPDHRRRREVQHLAE